MFLVRASSRDEFEAIVLPHLSIRRLRFFERGMRCKESLSAGKIFCHGGENLTHSGMSDRTSMLKEKKRNTHVVHESVRETYNAWNKETWTK